MQELKDSAHLNTDSIMNTPSHVFCVFQIFGLEFLLGSDTLWPLLLALTILPAILQSIMLPFCPESPRYLLIVLNQEEEARKGQF